MLHPGSLRRTPLPRPQRGHSTRHRCGRLELVLEPTRGGYVLVVHDGSDGRRYPLGLGDDGELQLVLRPPCYPVLVALRETLTLTPGARLRGYLQVPLVPTVVWHRPGNDENVCELLPTALATEWDEARQRCQQRSISPWLPRWVPAGDTPQVVVPMVVRNDSDGVQAIGELPLSLRDDELHELRGQIVAAPRRARCTDGRLVCNRRGEEPA